MQKKQTRIDDPIKVSRIGFGTWGIGGESIINGKITGTASRSEEDSMQAIYLALEKGITTFDTAPTYGRSESLLGRVDPLAALVVAAKIGLTAKGEMEFTAQEVEASIRATLRAINRDRIDIMQIRTPTQKPVPDPLVLELMIPWVEKGVIGALGVNLHGADQGMHLLETDAIQYFQVAYNLFDTRAQAFMDAAQRAGRVVLVKSPLNKGFLSSTGKHHYGEADYRHSYLSTSTVKQRRKFLSALCEEFNIPAEDLLRYAAGFVLAKPQARCILFGFKTKKHIEEILDIERNNPVNHQLVHKIERFSRDNRPTLDPYFH